MMIARHEGESIPSTGENRFEKAEELIVHIERLKNLLLNISKAGDENGNPYA